MASSEYVNLVKSEKQTYTIPSFKYEDGSVLDTNVAYLSINPSSRKKVLVPTCFSGFLATTCSYASAYNPELSAFSDYHIIVVAMLGNGESSSPSNTPNFPKSLDYRDQIRAQHSLVTKHLGISTLDAVVGFSMGGQQAYYWAAMFPEVVKNSICICGSARTTPFNYAFLEGPINALERSSDYDGGRYREKGIKNPESGVTAFGKAYNAWLFSPEFYNQEVWKKASGKETVAEFLETRNAGWLAVNADDLLILARQWQKGDIGVLGGGLEKTLSAIKTRMLILPGRTDQYFRPEDNEAEMKFLKNAEYDVIPSVWGHTAGGGDRLEDMQWVDARITRFLAKQES